MDIVINMKIGDKFRERMPKFVGNGKCYFSWIIEIIGFKKESYADFAICKRTDGNKIEIVNYKGIDYPCICYEIKKRET